MDGESEDLAVDAHGARRGLQSCKSAHLVAESGLVIAFKGRTTAA